MSTPTLWETLPAQAQADELTALFATVFGHAMTERQWAWKYADDRCLHVVARDGQGRCVAHAGLQYGGALAGGGLVGQVCDVMVHPDARGGLQAGLFAQTIERLAQAAQGRGYRVCYGFPGERPARLGIRLGVYEELLRPQEVVVAPRAARPRWRRALDDWGLPVRRLLPDGLPAALGVVQADRPAVAHGLPYVRWRHVDAPRPYGFWRVGRARALAVAVTLAQADGALRLVDWLGQAPCTAAWLQRLADAAGQPVVAWSHRVAGDPVGTRRPSPLVVIRLAAVGARADAERWLQAAMPGDVDIY